MTSERQIVFVTGEPGIGKTALLEAFLQGARLWELGSRSSPSQPLEPRAQFPNPGCWVAWGQCIEHYGPGEAYLPILSALSQLGRETNGQQLIDVLHQYAPTWLVQLPALLPASEFEVLQRKVQGATRGRMLRELAEALEALTTDIPLVLVLEDLHWSDPSTVEALDFLARRRQPAKLLVIGIYRPVAMLHDGHPLKRITHELLAHNLCSDLPLPLLTEADVTTYLQKRFPNSVFPSRLGPTLYRRTGGHPFFLVTIVTDWVNQGTLLERDGTWTLQQEIDVPLSTVPQNVRHLLTLQQDRLTPEDRRLLQVASIGGLEFTTAMVAAALEEKMTDVADRCAALVARQQFLQRAGITTWPDGTRAARYRFLHVLYHQIWHEEVGIERVQQWQRRLGERQEQAYGTRAAEIAAELALRFEQAGEYGKAIHYLEQAGKNALLRNAYQEAIQHLTKAIALLRTQPSTPERTRQELTLQITLGSTLQAANGYAASEVEQAYARARSLAQKEEDIISFPALVGLQRFYGLRGESSVAYELAKQCLALAQREQDSALLVEAHYIMAANLMILGEIAAAWPHIEQGSALYNLQHHSTHAIQYGHDPGVAHFSHASWVLWMLRCPDRALQQSTEALTLARTLAHGNSLAYALWFAAELHIMRRGWSKAREHGKALVAVATEYSLPLWLANSVIVQGWTLTEQGQFEEGLAQMNKGVATIRGLGGQLRQPQYLTHLAEGYGKSGQAEEGLKVVAEALATVNKTGERYYEAELYRLKGTLTLEARGLRLETSPSSPQAPSLKPLVPGEVLREAEEHFLEAIDIARQQSAKSWELRATMSLVCLRQQQMRDATRNTQHVARNNLHDTHQMLSDVYHWFTEGFDTADLKDAKALLDELSH